MPILRILCYNGSLVTRTVVGLTTATRRRYIHSARTQRKTTCIIDEACLPLGCVAIDVLLLSAIVCCGDMLQARFLTKDQCHDIHKVKHSLTKIFTRSRESHIYQAFSLFFYRESVLVNMTQLHFGIEQIF
jgi:hypothetical protein